MNDEEKRKHPRKKSTGKMRVYTSVSTAKYTVHLKDVSVKGAFINSKHIPKMGETITYSVIDDRTFKEIATGNAVVKWIKPRGTETTKGFGIELEKELTEELLEILNSEV